MISAAKGPALQAALRFSGPRVETRKASSWTERVKLKRNLGRIGYGVRLLWSCFLRLIEHSKLDALDRLASPELADNALEPVIQDWRAIGLDSKARIMAKNVGD